MGEMVGNPIPGNVEGEKEVQNLEQMTILSYNLHLPMGSGFGFLKSVNFVRAILGTQKIQSSHVPPVLTHTQPPPLSTSYSGLVHMLQLVTLHGHILITHTP